MKFSVAFAALAWSISSANAFVAVGGNNDGYRLQTNSALSVSSSSSEESSSSSSRRAVLETVGATSLASAFAVLSAPGSASAGLLDDFGTDPQKIQEAKKEEAARAAASAKPKAESTIEPNLRSNYYYPTNKKRYLPRCSDAIPVAAASIGDGDWESVSEFATKIADDTVLPMKLYTSSLTGGGTNVKVAFAKDMMNDANNFEKAQKQLVKAIGKKDQSACSKALENMSEALLAYRTTGKLLGPDGGGDIPSVDEIRRSACRVQGRRFEQKVKERDERLKEAAAST
eukprot:CAMPEP_0178720166 /NCGR_PEP_ID=MMETSP0699-20121125/23561_1 /TAXON_ID=265572 /ORGANISM="Extubocellulus spinifer, Strain CCMP396" /LENGTH=285 /DNA_ID=CAMNT_0020370547 /DNA_START=2248 /DNA_END=3105 /DNA_ORIENTATION=-